MRGVWTPRIGGLAEPRDATGRNDESHTKLLFGKVPALGGAHRSGRP